LFGITNIVNLILNPKDLGAKLRAERKARQVTQAWVAARVGCRRQTIADLEAGRNVAVAVLLGVASSLGKALAIVDAHVELEQLSSMFHGED
jgi:transcriptional regulator with XRE-family HTH domain